MKMYMGNFTGLGWTLMVILWCASLPHVGTFMPNFRGPTMGILGTSVTHKQLTEKALRRMAVLYMADHPGLYPDHQQAMATPDFREALKNFRDGVVRPDLEPSMADQSNLHFNNEQILQSNDVLLQGRLKVINAMKSGQMVAARQLAGQLLHTLQDFYSHTNWVDIGFVSENEALGVPGQDVGEVATLDQPTCLNCDSDTCAGDVRHELWDNIILTSGYMKAGQASNPNINPQDYKPVGKMKCSHGGVNDVTRTVEARGGINKDTNSDKYSPHHYNHRKAATVAEAASVRWLKGFREVRTEEEFSRFMGLESGTSLCFVVDTTGSMKQEIAAVRETTIRLTRDQASSHNTPTDYILVPFNDPGYGPVVKTTNPDVIIWHLMGLSASGGGDKPEMAFTGILEALKEVRPGSTCNLFTDAPAKDRHLSIDANALAKEKRVKINAFLTNLTTERKKREVRMRRKRQTSETPLLDMASMSGGHVIRSSKSDIGQVARIVDMSMTSTQVTILQVDYRGRTADVMDVFSIPVDESLTELVILVTATRNQGLSVEIADPTGVTQVPGVPNSSAAVILTVDSPKVKVVQIVKPFPGDWALHVVSGSTYSLRVTASSLVDFSYQFVENVNTGHGGYRPIPGKPMAGENVTMVIDIVGGVNDHVTHGLAEVTDLVLVNEAGHVIKRVELFMLETLSEYEATMVLPSKGFRVVLEGRDTQGNRVRRVNTPLVSGSVCSVEVEMDKTGSYSLVPGGSISIPIRVTNKGANMTYDVTVSDSLKYVRNITSPSLSLSSGESRMMRAEFRAPAHAPEGQVSTVIVTASDLFGDLSLQNFAVFHLSIVPKVIDTSPPECTIVSTTGECNQTRSGDILCSEEHWNISFMAEAAGEDLHSVKPSPLQSNTTFQLDELGSQNKGPIFGNYSANCCSPRISIVVSDVIGNIGHCKVDHIPEPTFPPIQHTTTTTPSGAIKTVVINTLLITISFLIIQAHSSLLIYIVPC